MSYCDWGFRFEAMKIYHDTEWGVPLHGDRKQFEYLMLEAMQCGLSWDLMIKKREIFRSCFDGFEPILFHNIREPENKKELLEPETMELLTTPLELADFKDAIMDALTVLLSVAVLRLMWSRSVRWRRCFLQQMS